MKKRIIIGSLIVIIISFIIYTYKLKASLFYHPDFSRDLHDILKITQGRPMLIGPKLTFGGLYLGPYYYYLFAPVFFVVDANIISILYFNAFLFAIALGYFFKKTYEIYPLWKTIIATLTLLFTPIFIVGSRFPSNAYSFIPLLLILLTYIYFNPVQKKLPLFIL